MEKRKEGIFRFKHFYARHERSSIKIGVDAVTLAAWANIPASGNILDVGTGCGVIALICAQRSLSSKIDAIDIDHDSIMEASENFNNSPWSSRLNAEVSDFIEMNKSLNKYELIISNPPFFNSGVNPDESVRMKGRHKGTLSPETLIEYGKEMITQDGTIALILPSDQSEDIVEYADKYSLYPKRHILLSGRHGKSPKRYLVEFSKIKTTYSCPEVLYIRESAGNFTQEYCDLCKELYLAF